jgi:hypothetical protein
LTIGRWFDNLPHKILAGCTEIGRLFKPEPEKLWQHIGMKSVARNRTSAIMRYRGALKTIDRLQRAFGLEKQGVYMTSETIVAHSQPTFGNG